MKMILHSLFVIVSCSFILVAAKRDGFRQDSSVLYKRAQHHRKLKSSALSYSALLKNSRVKNKGTCTIADRLERGFARKGDEFRRTITPDAAICANMCADTVTGCVAIDYRESDGLCAFLGDPGYIHVEPGYTTALMNPTLNSVCNSDNMILGYDRRGGDLSGNPHTVENATECCAPVLPYLELHCIYLCNGEWTLLS